MPVWLGKIFYDATIGPRVRSQAARFGALTQ